MLERNCNVFTCNYHITILALNKLNGRICQFVKAIWMASCTSGLIHIKKTMKMDVIDSSNLINLRVSHSGIDYLVTDFVTFLC